MQDQPSRRSIENDIATQKFAVGQPVRRKEDDTLVRGKGKYTDDVSLPGQAYGYVVRSSHAHGIIKSINTETAREMPGVLGIWTGADLIAAGYQRIATTVPAKNRDGSPVLQTSRPALTVDKVRFVGDPVAFVVALTFAQAREAGEAVEIDIDPLPSVTSAEAASRPGAPQLYDNIPNNVALDFHFGDTTALEAAFAKAAHITKLDLVNNRLAVVPLEPRAALASYDKKIDRFTIIVPTQGVAGSVALLAKHMNLPKEKIHLLTYNVGGSFGMKNTSYPEYICIMHATKALGRPVKWTDDRSGSFLSDNHGRGQNVQGELALAADGTFLGVRITGFGNFGAYIAMGAPIPLSQNIPKNIASVYKTPLIVVDIKCVVTNTTFMGAYRGAGRPEANYYMERLIDRAADEMGIDRLTLRKRNFVKSSQMPYSAASGQVYDSGDFGGVFNKAVELSDFSNFAKRKRESRKHGKLRGIAIGSYLEVTAPPNTELSKISFNADGTVTIATGTLDYGQGHAAPFAQLLGTHLGVPFDAVKLEQSDSDIVHTGNGTGGSRSITASGTAIFEASKLIVEKGKKAAAHLLEASAGDIEFSGGRFTIAGTDRSIGIMELASKLRDTKVPDDVPSSLDVDHTAKDIASTFPNGCHVAEVEIDPDTGVIKVMNYTGVNDFGVVVNPMIVEGQLHGGIAQGIGQSLMECVTYDDNGQPITGSFMDYALPRAGDVPTMAIGNHPSPAKTNPLGTKGCGEAGCAGSLVTIANAVIDALSEYGVTEVNMPLTSEKIWRAIQDGEQAKSA